MTLVSDIQTRPASQRRQEIVHYYPEQQTSHHSEAFNIPIEEEGDEKDWLLAGDTGRGFVDSSERVTSLDEVRYLARHQPNVVQALRLYNFYLIGGGFEVYLEPKDDSKIPTERDTSLSMEASEAIKAFAQHNRKWWSYGEFIRRKYRDGEVFSKKMKSTADMPELRFIDPEEIADPSNVVKAMHGIITPEDDVSAPQAYTRIKLEDRTLMETIEAVDMFHTKINADSTEKRGVSQFFPVRQYARRYQSFLSNEVIHRIMQSSIVIHRKVQGSPGRVTDLMNSAKTSTTEYPEGTMHREKIRPGTMLTTNKNVEIEFRHPESNFSDASPLGKLLVMQVAAATGWPYFAISADSGDANFASSLVQESPTIMMVMFERAGFKSDMDPILRWVIERAIRSGSIRWKSKTKSIFDEYNLDIRLPSLETRDPLKEGQRCNIGIMNGSLSVAESSRQQGVNPARMRAEREREMEEGVLGMQMGAMNTPPDTMDPNNNTGQNQDADGTQQGGDDATQTARRGSQGQ